MIRSPRGRGHTLAELVVSLALITALSGVAALLLSTVRRDDRIAQAYADDLQHLRRASDMLADALRGASEVERVGAALVVDGERWTVGDGALQRNGKSVVRGISRLEVTHESAALWTVGVAPVTRRAGATAPLLRTTTRVRGEAAR